MTKTKIAQGIVLALSVGVTSSAFAAATTMYNGYKFDSAASNTDGWVYGGIGYNPSTGSLAQRNGIVNPNYTGPTLYQATSLSPLTFNDTPLTIGVANFYGIGGSSTPSTSTPFGYVGSSHLNWAVDITGGGSQTAEISVADAQSRYGFTAEVDTGAGAWQDVASTPDTGWKHQTDIGLIRTDTDSLITLNLTRMSAPSTPGLTNDNFGVTVFTGMDTNTGGYAHHGAWNCPDCTTPSLFTKNDPFGTTGLTYLTHDSTVDSVNGISFLAQAGQVYSIYLGGAGVGQWSQNVSDYKLSVAASAVPIPAAAWLFGSALAGMGVIGRRKNQGETAA
jgi:hypothetical protein